MKTNPDLSAIICTYNRYKFLPGSLGSLVNQTLSPDKYEIIIINNNSTDGTEEISKDFIQANPQLNVKYFLETERGLSAARNRSIKESLGEILVFLDDDAEARNDYLETAYHFFKSNPHISAIGGKINPVFEDGQEPKWLSKYLWGLISKADYGNVVREYPYSKAPYGASMAFRKSALLEIGGFNRNLLFRSEDKYAFCQLTAHGKKFLYNPNFVVAHHISEQRTTYEAIKNISIGVGAGEHDRIRNMGLPRNILKVAEYIFKLFAGITIAFGFLAKLEFVKAEYIVKNRWYTLLGYFKSGRK